MALQFVEKRDGKVVDFDSKFIQNAIFAAARSVGGENEAESGKLAEAVVQILEKMEKETINVEMIQDIVEKVLIENGHAATAKSYILYRHEREEARKREEAERVEKVDRGEISVHKRDGTLIEFTVKEIEKFVNKCAESFPSVNTEKVIAAAKRNFYDGISTSEINKALLMAARSYTEKDPEYSKFTAKILLNELYEEILKTKEFKDGFQTKYRENFKNALQIGVDCGRLDPRILEFDLEKISAALEPERDQLFEYLGIQTLFDRYFLRDYEQNIFELPQYFWMRVAMGLCFLEDNKEEKALEFYKVMSNLRYVPSTPTLFHSGTTHAQMSSCYLTTVNDDLSHIFKCVGDNAQLAKWSGGIGNDFTNIRATGSLIKATNVPGQGVIPFLKIIDSTTAAIARSGKRRGATCVYLETWHYDIEDFLDLRRNTGDERRRTHDINTANWIPDLFMKRVNEGGKWTLFSPSETPELHDLYGKAFEEKYEEYEKMAENGEIEVFKQMEAKKLWRKMITMIFETGHPWITFKDPCNIRSPQDHVGVVHSSNLCTEITLNTSKDETAVCNLGSVNLSRHVTIDGKDEEGFEIGANYELNKELMSETIEVAMRMLDNVIDLNFYPTVEAKNSNMRHRPVGLGMMGLQDAIFKLGLNFDSEEAVNFSDNLMEFVSYHAILNSSKLAEERGTYESYEGSKWDRNLFPLDTLDILEDERGMETGVPKNTTMDWSEVRDSVKKNGMRNSNCMAIAPTATISNIAGCLPTIEPIYKNLYVKSNVSGEFTVLNKFLVQELKEKGLWNDELIAKVKHYDGSIQNIFEIPEEIRGRYKESFEIDSSWVISHGARRAKWLDQSQSINLFINSQSGKVISNAYMNAWKSGLKTTYYLRTLGASAIEKSSIDINKKYDSTKSDSEKSEPATAVKSGSACGLNPDECEACQ